MLGAFVFDFNSQKKKKKSKSKKIWGLKIRFNLDKNDNLKMKSMFR